MRSLVGRSAVESNGCFSALDAKLEYLYAEINGYTNTYTTTAQSFIATYDDLHANIARIGVNYHF